MYQETRKVRMHQARCQCYHAKISNATVFNKNYMLSALLQKLHATIPNTNCALCYIGKLLLLLLLLLLLFRLIICMCVCISECKIKSLYR